MAEGGDRCCFRGSPLAWVRIRRHYGHRCGSAGRRHRCGGAPGLIPGPGFASRSPSASISLSGAEDRDAPPLSKQTGEAAAPSLAAGFLLAIANPKAWFAIAAVFTGSTLLESSRELDALLKAAVLAVMIVLIHLCWLLGGVSLAGFLRDPLRSRIVNVLFGLVLVGTAVVALMH